MDLSQPYDGLLRHANWGASAAVPGRPGVNHTTWNSDKAFQPQTKPRTCSPRALSFHARQTRVN